VEQFLTSKTRPDYAKYRRELIGGTNTLTWWRDTVQIPDYIVNRPSSDGDRFFEALNGQNAGYVFRLRVCDPATEYKIQDDYDWFGRLVPSYRLECFVKGVFNFYNEDTEQTEQTWGCICYTEFEPLGVIELEAVADSAEFAAWLEGVIGAYCEVAFQDSGKWSWAQGFQPVFAHPSETDTIQEPWAIMFEQQFSSLFSQIVTQDKPAETQSLVEGFMTGYREWIHIKEPLKDPIIISYGVPADWDPPQFWSGWRSLGEFGELLFDFWSRDIDSWWLDTFRRAGYTLALVPEGREVLWTEESDITRAKATIANSKHVGLEIRSASSSAELRNLLTSHFSSQRESLESVSDARKILYQEWQAPISYEGYEEVLAIYLDQLKFWDKAERFLLAKKCRLAIVPIRGRCLVL